MLWDRESGTRGRTPVRPWTPMQITVNRLYSIIQLVFPKSARNGLSYLGIHPALRGEWEWGTEWTVDLKKTSLHLFRSGTGVIGNLVRFRDVPRVAN